MFLLCFCFFCEKAIERSWKRIFKVVENVVHLEFVGCTLSSLNYASRASHRWSFSECAAMQLHLGKQVCKGLKRRTFSILPRKYKDSFNQSYSNLWYKSKNQKAHGYNWKGKGCVTLYILFRCYWCGKIWSI